MKKFTPFTKGLSLILCVSILFSSCSNYDNTLFSGKQNIRSSETMRQSNFSGKDIMKSLYFGHGKFRDAIPKLSSQPDYFSPLPSSEKDSIDLKIEEIFRIIEKNHPNFLEDFSEKMLSSENPQAITDCLTSSNLVIKEAMYEAFPILPKIIVKIKKDIKSKRVNLNNMEDVKNYMSNEDFSSVEFDDLLDDNTIAVDNICGAVVCLLAVYMVAGIHNAVAITAVAAVVFAVTFWVGSKRKGITGETWNDLPNSMEEANLKVESIISSIATFNKLNNEK